MAASTSFAHAARLGRLSADARVVGSDSTGSASGAADWVRREKLDANELAEEVRAATSAPSVRRAWKACGAFAGAFVGVAPAVAAPLEWPMCCDSQLRAGADGKWVEPRMSLIDRQSTTAESRRCCTTAGVHCDAMAAVTPGKDLARSAARPGLGDR